ncbi:carboxypeptidase regulatory-like domain-containing protein [Corallococcus sp. BB11-1]|uniref:carboxypeptidase regulatory-like domain-containing protein n=1 Tax=Corallococcus sp. BB11-1 TaxID=2996783 RepID=UPI00226DDA48|nr:carboxypeptidase regulatory-like domain-containing protein [Corallococcus sp. BB11-1]MCY1032900.1 carboxypeptidase regulatory-like domain-containing protein [Corallococcus sp. BB11-1]
MRPMRLSPSVLLLGLALTLAACKGSEEPSTPQPTTTARLTGKVALEGAASPEGILVALTGTTLNASTDAQGAFLLEAVPPGTHELTAARQGYTTVRQTVSVSAGESAALSLTLKVARGRLSGVITLEGASTSAGIAVTLTNTTVAATTSAQGRFTLENLPLGTYELVATKDGYTPLRVSVEVQEGNAQSVTQVLARLRGQVVGQVLLEGRANPEGLQVSLEGRSERATTDAQGRFTLENLAPGTYTLQAEKELYATARQPVEVKSAEATSLTLTLARLKGELRGTVLRDDVGPQDNGGITVTLALPGSPLSTSTNDTGGFVFTGVPTGTYEVQARRDAYLEDRQSVTLLANQSTSTQLTLARLRGRIEGQVLLSDGADASGLTVSLSGTNTRATTDAQGRFMLEGIPTGTYALATRKEHHSPLTQSVEVTANSTATPTLLLTRLQPPTLTAVSERGVQGGRLTLTGVNLDYSWDPSA